MQVKRLSRAGGRGRCGAWMFAEMLIHFHFGKLLHYPYVLLIREVMPNFFGDVHACVCIFDVLIFRSMRVRTGNHGPPDELRLNR